MMIIKSLTSLISFTLHINGNSFQRLDGFEFLLQIVVSNCDLTAFSEVQDKKHKLHYFDVDTNK